MMFIFECNKHVYINNIYVILTYCVMKDHLKAKSIYNLCVRQFNDILVFQARESRPINQNKKIIFYT